MPKYTAKDAQRPLVEAAPMLIEREQTGDLLPASRPKFAPATTLEQNGRKMEFRRVSAVAF